VEHRHLYNNQQCVFADLTSSPKRLVINKQWSWLVDVLGFGVEFFGLRLGWRRGVVVTRWVKSTKLFYAGPG